MRRVRRVLAASRHNPQSIQLTALRYRLQAGARESIDVVVPVIVAVASSAARAGSVLIPAVGLAIGTNVIVSVDLSVTWVGVVGVALRTVVLLCIDGGVALVVIGLLASLELRHGGCDAGAEG